MTLRLRAPWQHPSWVRGLSAATVLAGVFLLPDRALALWDDKLMLSAAEKVTRDDNVFRISKDVDPTAVIRSPSKGDTYHITSFGLNFDVPASRQRFLGNYTWNDTRFNHFTDLDFTGHDSRAVWLWQLGNHSGGQLGYSETSALASFTNIQSRSPDILKMQQSFVDASVLVASHWRVRAGASTLRLRNSDPARQVNDIDIVDSDMSASYITSASTSIGLAFRTEDGSFPNRQLVGGILVDNGYWQYGAGMVAEWTITGVSHLGGRVEHVRRSYGQLSQRDFDGTTARMEYDWKPTGKLSLAGSVRRDISAYEDIRTSFILVRGITLSPTLSLTEKMDVSGTVDYSVREYLGDPGLVSTGLPTRSDHVLSAGMTISYRPGRTLTLQLGAQRERRTSNIAFADYLDNVVFASARVAF